MTPRTMQAEFRSSLAYAPEEVQGVLNKKIQEEETETLRHSTPVTRQLERDMHANIRYRKNVLKVVSLFSGAGGLDLGVKLATLSCTKGAEESLKILADRQNFENHTKNIDFIYSNDIFPAANESYMANFGLDVVKDSRDIRQVIEFPASDLMLGGFPCPGFSAAGPRLLDDPRNFLYIHYIRALTQSKPTFFIAENVKGLMTMARGQVLKQITEDFSAAGYQVVAHLVNARDYGVPQIRERVFIIGVRNDIVKEYGYEYHLPEPTHGPGRAYSYTTLRDAIGDLPYQPEDVFDSNYSSMYMSRNRKKSWDEQSFTIQASGRQAPQHPEGSPMLKLDKDKWVFQGDCNRRLSVQECARIQTFPDWYHFSTGVSNASKNSKLNEQYKQIGNAVPVLLAEKISRPILQFMLDHNLYS